MYYNNQSTFGITPVVKNLIIINVVVFIADKFVFGSRGIDLSDYLALYHPASPYFKPHQLITSLFMHADITHILYNMLGVFFFGRMLENVWGSKRFLSFYMICGIGASLVYLAWSSLDDYRNMPDQSVELFKQAVADFRCVGASGAVFGLMMGAAMLFPNTVFHIYGIIPIRLAWLAVLYGAFEIIMGIRNAAGDNVAHFAHIGGLIFGLIMVLIYKRNKKNFY
jgi:membrane associated rhomboid family serine protease